MSTRIRIAWLTIALVLGPASARAQMTCNGADFAFVPGTSAAPVLALPTSAPVGATIVVGIMNRTDETTTLTVSDPSNGAYPVATFTQPVNSGRVYLAHVVNNGTAGAHTITGVLSVSITWQMVVGWCRDPGGPQTFDSHAPLAEILTSVTYVSDTVPMDGPGGIVGFISTNNGVTATAVGAGELLVEGGSAGQRLTVMFQPVAGAGAEGFSSTVSTISNGMYLVAGFLNATGGGGGGMLPPTGLTTLGVGR